MAQLNTGPDDPVDVTNGQTRRQRRRILHSDRTQWALEHFGPLRNGEPPKPIKTIAEEHHRKPAVITRQIFQAFKEGLVEFRQKPETIIKSVARLEKIEKDLQIRFNLQGAVVIGLGPTSQTDESHRILGQAVAQFLSGAPGFFREKDVIGFGSGRTVYYIIDALRRLPELRVGGVTLASVTGALHPRDHAGELPVLCDADFHTNLCAMNFVGQPRPEMRLMHTLLACKAEQREKELAQTWLGSEWHDSPVSHLICGTGVLSKGHRLHLSSKANSEEARLEEAGLEPVVEQLRRLSRLADDITRRYPDYHPVGDICNFLFYIENPALADHTADEIRRLVDSVNKCLLNIQKDQLFRIGSIILTAATAKKRWVVSQLLTPNPFRRGGDEKKKLAIRYLCVDREIAEWLLNQTSASVTA